MRTAFGAVVLSLAVVACAGARDRIVPSTPAAREAPDGNARLGRDVVPSRYTLDLSVDPAADHLSGRVDIEVDVMVPTRRIVLHGDRLTIGEASVFAWKTPVAAHVVTGVNGGLAVETESDLPAGRSTLSFRFEAPMGDVQEGAFRVTDGGATYAFTQFESLYARRAFPCFDEPGFRTPWRVRLRVPHGLVAVSNAPEASRQTEGGVDVVRFAETQPLPTYLVAFAVGPFDVVAAPEGATAVPIRILAPRGKGRLAGWALERAPKALAALERWFGDAYPFDKLDLVALPGFDWGGMENAGLITFRENLLLLDPAIASATTRSFALTTITHEMSHMWFGDLVTMAWWDDVWLNEAFATLMESRIADAVEPELRAGTQAIAAVGSTMRLDAKSDTRSVRQPIASGGDVFNAFDDITYGKGCRVLAMCEAWMGPKEFQRAMRRYIAAHRYGTATTADLYAALQAETKEPVGAVLSGFVDRPGTPFIDFQTSQVVISKVNNLPARQSRYLPLGGRPETSAVWQVPARFKGASEIWPTLIRDNSIELPDPFVKWLFPDAEATGYFVWKLPEKELSALAREHRSDLTPEERIAFLRDLSLLLESGDVSPAAYMDDLAAFAADDDPLVLCEVVASLTRLAHLAVDERVEPKFAAWVRGLVAPHVERVGFKPQDGERPDVRMFRESLLRALVFLGHDETLRAAAEAAASRFLADPSSMPTDEAETVLTAAARTGDAALRQRYVDAANAAPDASTHRLVVAALGAFGDPDLVTRSLDLVLDGRLLQIDLWRLTLCMEDDPSTRKACWAWITRNYDRLRKLRGEEWSSDFPMLAASFRTTADREAIAAFFATIPSPPEGTARNLAIALETIEQNARLHDALAPGVAAYLAGR